MGYREGFRSGKNRYKKVRGHFRELPAKSQGALGMAKMKTLWRILGIVLVITIWELCQFLIAQTLAKYGKLHFWAVTHNNSVGEIGHQTNTSSTTLNGWRTSAIGANAKVIAWWVPKHRSPHKVFSSDVDKRLSRCAKPCRTLRLGETLSEADAVIFNTRDNHLLKNPEAFPARSRPDQIYVFHNREAPLRTKQLLRSPHLQDVFNLTMTYRLDSDIKIPYFTVKHRPMVKSAQDINTRNKSKLAIWIISHCDKTGSARWAFGEALSRYMPLDIYGKCGMPCPRFPKNFCLDMAERDYKFYLALENAVCKDYITEKLTNPLSINIVPVVLGGLDYDADVAPKAVIDIRKFESPRHLAEYLTYLDKNDTAYEEHLQWKRYRTVTRKGTNHWYCPLCDILHDRNYSYKTHFDPYKWWVEDGNCMAEEEQRATLGIEGMSHEMNQQGTPSQQQLPSISGNKNQTTPEKIWQEVDIKKFGEEEMSKTDEQEGQKANVGEKEISEKVGQIETAGGEGLSESVGQEEEAVNAGKEGMPEGVGQEEEEGNVGEGMLQNMEQEDGAENVGEQGRQEKVGLEDAAVNLEQGAITEQVGQEDEEMNVGEKETPNYVGQEEEVVNVEEGEMPNDVGQAKKVTNVGEEEISQKIEQRDGAVNVGEEKIPENMGQYREVVTEGEEKISENVKQEGEVVNVGEGGVLKNTGQAEEVVNMREEEIPGKLEQEDGALNVGEEGIPGNVGQENQAVNMGQEEMLEHVGQEEEALSVGEEEISEKVGEEGVEIVGKGMSEKMEEQEEARKVGEAELGEEVSQKVPEEEKIENGEGQSEQMGPEDMSIKVGQEDLVGNTNVEGLLNMMGMEGTTQGMKQDEDVHGNLEQEHPTMGAEFGGMQMNKEQEPQSQEAGTERAPENIGQESVPGEQGLQDLEQHMSQEFQFPPNDGGFEDLQEYVGQDAQSEETDPKDLPNTMGQEITQLGESEPEHQSEKTDQQSTTPQVEFEYPLENVGQELPSEEGILQELLGYIGEENPSIEEDLDNP